MRNREWIDFVIAWAIGLVVVSIIGASEPPPQCNLPGWQAVKADVCKCGVACECGDQVTIATKVPKTLPTVKQSLTVRAPVGHTHTCKNGHTWDHTATASHNCPICGAYQNVQDRSPRPVTVARVTNATIAHQSAPSVFVLPRASSGCANGNCAYPR